MTDAHVEAILARLRPMVEDRPVILAGGPLAGMAPRLNAVRILGARQPLCVAFGLGTGPVPREEEADRFVVPQQEQPLLQSIYEEMRLLADPGPDLRAALDAYDPQCQAVVLAGPFMTSGDLAGRPVLDGRRPAWEALEDKTQSEALWDGAGIECAPSLVVPATESRLRTAARELDRGDGTVWAGDAREGFNGGSSSSATWWTPPTSPRPSTSSPRTAIASESCRSSTASRPASTAWCFRTASLCSGQSRW